MAYLGGVPMVAAIFTGIVNIIDALFISGWLFLLTVVMCFFLLYFLGLSDEQRKETNELVIKVIERFTREKEKSKWRY